MMFTRRVDLIQSLVDELAAQLGALDTEAAHSEHVTRMMWNTAALQRNLRPLMARERDRA